MSTQQESEQPKRLKRRYAIIDGVRQRIYDRSERARLKDQNQDAVLEPVPGSESDIYIYSNHAGH